MESDNENSLASSVSSFSRRLAGIESENSNKAPRFSMLGEDEQSIQLSDFDNEGSIQSQEAAPYRRKSQVNGPISKIPPEVLLLIFSQFTLKSDLVSLLTVCKSWSDLVVGLLWFRPTLASHKSFEGIYQVMKKDRSETFWDYRKFIRRLNLSFTFERVDDEFLGLFTNCVNLERLTLVNCSKLSYKPIVNILQGCSKLQSIDLTGVDDIRDDILIALAENCHRLQGFYAPGCPLVTNAAVVAVVNNCPLLKRVKISDNNNVDDDAICEMTQRCKALIEVDVHNCPNLSDHSLQRVFTDLDQLREFRISHNHNVSDLLLQELPERMLMDKLRIVDFTGCVRITDKLVQGIVDIAPRLRNVVLSKCLNITDASLRALAGLGKNLHYIHLGHCSNITDFGVIALVRNCQRLQYIDLACCTQLTNISLVELGHLQRLRRIGLVKCSNITDSGILQLIQNRGYDDTLERVHLSYCTNIGVHPIYELLHSCPRLTHLSLTGVHAFLTPEITRFCRQPPSDFNEYQKALFCVFSGPGVKQLREYLTKVVTVREAAVNPSDEVQLIAPDVGVQRLNEMYFRRPPSEQLRLPREQAELEDLRMQRRLQTLHFLAGDLEPQHLGEVDAIRRAQQLNRDRAGEDGRVQYGDLGDEEMADT